MASSLLWNSAKACAHGTKQSRFMEDKAGLGHQCVAHPAALHSTSSCWQPSNTHTDSSQVGTLLTSPLGLPSGSPTNDMFLTANPEKNFMICSWLVL